MSTGTGISGIWERNLGITRRVCEWALPVMTSRAVGIVAAAIALTALYKRLCHFTFGWMVWGFTFVFLVAGNAFLWF